LKSNAVWDIYILGVERDVKRAIRAKPGTNGTQVHVPTVITHKLCDTYHGQFEATPIYAAACSPKKERLYFRSYVKRGDNIKGDLKEMGCDDVDYITWLVVAGPWVKMMMNLLFPHKVISELKVTTIFSRTNLPRELN